MQIRVLRARGDGTATVEDTLPEGDVETGWVWTDVLAGPDDIEELVELVAGFEFDPLAVRDAVEDFDLPKVDDFGHHLLVILHGLRDDRIETYEVDCFLTDRHLVTVHLAHSQAIDALWTSVVANERLARGSADELLARVSDVLSRRLLAVNDAFDQRAEELVAKALDADPSLVAELTAVRADVATVRRVVGPQRETLDVLRTSQSPVLSDRGRRRFSDAFDVTSRTAYALDASRTALAEILDAYRGAEARHATDVTKVLTVYAAIMLPLSLVAGFFGMNFENLPWIDKAWGWVVVTVGMGVIGALSLGVFVVLGWIRRPSGRRAGVTIGRGLIEAARAPAQIVGAVYEISTMPLRATTRRSDSGSRD